MSFAVDHIWMATADRDGWCERLSELTGLPVLDGWSPGGTLWSRGIRFANGPFLDIHNPPPDGTKPEPSLMLGGELREAVGLAEQQSWRLKTSLRSDVPLDQASPWSLGYFSRGQGLLNRIGLIEYEIDPASCGNDEYAAPLFALGSQPDTGPRLERVWMNAIDVDRAELDLSALGFRHSGEFQPGVGRHLRGEGCDIVLCSGEDGVVQLDISGARWCETLQLQGLTVVITPS